MRQDIALLVGRTYFGDQLVTYGCTDILLMRRPYSDMEAVGQLCTAQLERQHHAFAGSSTVLAALCDDLNIPVF